MKNLLIFISITALLFSCSKENNRTSELLPEKTEKVISEQLLLLEKSMNEFAKDFDGSINIIQPDNQSHRNDEECKEYIVQAFDCFEAEVTELIAVEPYCSLVEVSYSFEICTDAGFGQPIQMIITDFIATPIPTLQQSGGEIGCDEFIDELNGLPLQEKTELFEQFQYAASLVVEQQLASEWVVILDVVCSDQLLQANFFRDLCYGWRTLGEVNNGETYPVILIEKILCGEQCCLRKTYYCLDHGTLTSTEPEFEQIGECDSGGRVECTNECGAIE